MAPAGWWDGNPGKAGYLFTPEQLERGRRMVTLAYKELARPVIEDPPASNTGVRIRLYQAATWLPGTRWAWCVAMWVWLRRETFGESFTYPTAGAYDLLRRGAAGGFQVTHPYPGCAVIFNLGTGHCATFVAFEDDGQVVVTVDGNSQNRVLEAKRPTSTVAGYVAPELPVGRPEPKAPKPPIYQAVTSEDGTVQIIATGNRFKVAKGLAGRIAYLLSKGKVVIRGADGEKIVVRRQPKP